MPLRPVRLLPSFARSTPALLATVLACVVTPASAQQASAQAASVSSLTLAEVVALAKERAPVVRAAFARVASAEAGVDLSRAAILPSLSFQVAGSAFASNGQVYASGVVSSTSSEYYAVGAGALNLQWTLYDFGHTSRAIDAAVAGVTSAKLLAQATEQVAMAEAAVAFFTLLADDAFVAAAKTARADREHIVTVTQHLTESGYRTQVDETRARIALEVADLELSTAIAARDSDSVSLASALLLDPATTFRLTAPAPLAVDDSGRNAELALHARRDVAAAAARVDQARLNVDSAKRAHLPTLAALAAGQILYAHDTATSGGTTASVDGPTEFVQGSLTVTVPIFDSLVNANVRAAEAGLGEARANLEQIALSARSDALQASRQVRSARALLEQSQRLAAGTAANLGAIEDRYEAGMESPLSLADAQREDALARTAIVRAQLAVEIAAVRLLAGLSRTEDLLKTR